MRKLGFGILMALLSLFVFNMDLEARKTWATGKHGIKVLILCTGNTCRSQMAHVAVYSGGVSAEKRVNPRAVMVMREMGIDISDHTPHQVDEYLNEDWDYVITVCDHAKETCPVFNGKVKHLLHTGSYDFIMSEFRRIRDQINDDFFKLYTSMEERK